MAVFTLKEERKNPAERRGPEKRLDFSVSLYRHSKQRQIKNIRVWDAQKWSMQLHSDGKAEKIRLKMQRVTYTIYP